jgi:hypothetical protein
MIGPKKLSAIRRELEAALTKEGRTPIEWLDERIRELDGAGPQADGGEVLRSLRRFLASKQTRRRRSPVTNKRGRR